MRILRAALIALLAGCAGTGTIVVGDEGQAMFVSDALKKCPGEHFELTIEQQDAAGNPLPPVTTDGYAAAGSIQFSAKGIDFARPVKLTIKGACGDLVFPMVTDWIALHGVPGKPNVYIVDFKKFHPAG